MIPTRHTIHQRKNNHTTLTDATNAKLNLYSVATTEGVPIGLICWNHDKGQQKNKRISELIWSLMQLAAKAFQGTCVTDTPGTNQPQRSELRVRMHRARVCLICNSFIRGYHRNGIPTIKGQNVKEHFDQLSVEKYEKFHKVHLKPELIKQYKVKGLKGMLLS